MQADEPLRPVGDRGQARDRDRGGVGGEQRAVAQVRLQGAEDLLLDLFVFGGSLDGEVGAADLLQAFGAADTGKGAHAFIFADDSARNLPGHVVVNERKALRDAVGSQVVEEHIVAGQGAYMRNTAAHLARADDADRLDIRHKSPPRALIWGASPSVRPFL